MSDQPEALRLADALEQGTYLLSRDRNATAALLRRQHAEIESAHRAQREAENELSRALARHAMAETALKAERDALRAVNERMLKAEPEPVADPFADIRGKRMSELNDEQADRARERWLRDQIDPQESYWYPHLQALFRIIDRLRAAPAEPEPEAVAWINWWRDHGQYNFRATSEMTFERAKELMKLAFEVGREAAPPTRRQLTDEEIDQIADSVNPATPLQIGKRLFARAIERRITGGNDE